MCLAIPGRLLEVTGKRSAGRTGRVDFGGVARDVNLTFLPEANPGDYVLVHVGFALAVIDEDEACRIFEDLAALAERDEAGAEDNS